MEKLAPLEITVMLLGFAVMLGLARFFGELFHWFKQPAIVGEILAGILLGPTVLGLFAPDLFGFLFPQAGPVALIAICVIGAIYGGIATPTEAGAVGAAAAIVVALAARRLSGSVFATALDSTVRTTAMFLLLLIGGLFSSFALTRLGVPQQMSEFLTSLDVAPWVIIVAINVFLLILGMFLDPLSILVIVVPIFLKSILALGYDPIWFGVIVTIQIEIAAITPPLGFNLFVLRKVVPDSDFNQIVAGSVMFVIPLLLGIALLMVFPEIALYLVSLAY